MILTPSFSAWAAIELAANHLWQSTLFTAVAGLLTLALRNNRAQVRSWLWLAASVKFLVPFAALVALGRQLGLRSSLSIPQPELTFVWDAMSQPFSRPALHVTEAASPATAFSSVAAALPFAPLAIWLCGCALILLAWWVRWRRIAVEVRDASPVEGGRELEALRRLENICGTKLEVALVSSDTSREPGVFGILRPVLMWPRGIADRLGDAQVEAILAHEVCHVRRRDNLAAAVHMLVEAMFWFHPLVWWLGARLVDERERACDEEVIRLGSKPEVYAESILKMCEFYVESPLVCVAGVTGSNLQKRIKGIMSNHVGETLNTWRKLLLAAVGVVAIAGPLVVGALTAPRLRAQAQADAGSPAFEVASVKPNKSTDVRVMMLNQPGGRFTATNATLRMLIRTAYRLQDFQIVGGPGWLNADRFDIIAKAEGNPTPDRVASMMRALLVDRFTLTAHHETRELPIYALVVARSDGRIGPHLRPTDCVGLNNAPPPPGPPDPAQPQPCGTIRTGAGGLTLRGAAISQVLQGLSPLVNRVVVDRTGLAGNFDMDLTWTPEQPPQGTPAAGASPPAIDQNGPSIYTAVQEQLGLKLDSQKGPVDVLVIDRVEHPTEN